MLEIEVNDRLNWIGSTHDENEPGTLASPISLICNKDGFAVYGTIVVVRSTES